MTPLQLFARSIGARQCCKRKNFNRCEAAAAPLSVLPAFDLIELKGEDAWDTPPQSEAATDKDRGPDSIATLSGCRQLLS